MILLYSSGQKGQCFVETKSLDGETNLKIKNTKKEIQERYHQAGGQSKIKTADLANIKASINCEKPNNAIYKFEGVITIEGLNNDEDLALGPDNVLLRGMSLKNTEEVYGLVVYTGHDTKIMQNTAQAKYKFSNLELMMNKAIVGILCFQFTLSLIGAVKGYHWLGANLCIEGEECKDVWTPYLPKVEDYDFSEYFVMVGTWILMMTNMVPVSLLVSFEVVKYV